MERKAAVSRGGDEGTTCVIVLGARNLKSWCGRAMLPVKPVGELPSLLLPVWGWPSIVGHPWLTGVSVQSLPVFTRVLPMCP